MEVVHQRCCGIGSVANRWLRGEVRGMSASEELCSDPEHAVNEADLTNDIALCQPAHLSLADHVHRLVSLDRSQRIIDGSEPEAGGDPLLHESMILLQDII